MIRDHLKSKSSFCLFVCLFLRRLRRSDLSLLLQLVFFTRSATRKIRALKREKT